MSETRTFKPHPNLLMDVIRRQAGTLSKAILEAVMNSIDAGSTKCEITLERGRLKVADDGKGFAGRQEIEQFFEVFGTPHSAGDAVYGQFRMGRGQLFAFGRNEWRSNTFRMDVDVLAKGLDYVFHDGLPVEQGCKVDIMLYSPLSNGDLHQCGEDVKSFVAYTAIPVMLNGKQVNKVLSEQKWEHEDESAYMRFTQTGSLKVYNLGVFVREFYSGHFGVGGVVVSKKQLKVNFARNDVMSDCPVWQKIKKAVQANAMREIKKRPAMDDAGRERMARMFHDDADAYDKTEKIKLITDVQGRHHTIWSAFHKCGNRIVVAPDHDRVGDIIMQTERAFVIAQSTLDRFGVADLDELVGLLREGGAPGWVLDGLEFPDYKKLAKEANSQFRIVPQDKWTPQEQVWLMLAKYFRFDDGYDGAEREIKLGDAEGVNGWTDGKSYIAINRPFLLGLSYTSPAALGKLGRLLLHEYCHNSDNTESDIHGHEFYRAFHEQADAIGWFVEEAISRLPSCLVCLSRGMNKRTAKMMDKIEAVKKAAQGVEVAVICAQVAKENAVETDARIQKMVSEAEKKVAAQA